MSNAPPLYEAMVTASHHLITIRLDREPRWYDLGVFLNPKLDPQWIDRDSRSWSSEESVDDVMNEHFSAQTTDALYATLDRPFLLLANGQRIYRILIARCAWDESRVGATAEFLEDAIRRLLAARDDAPEPIASTDIDTLTNQMRSAA